MEFGPYRDGDEASILQTFARVFGDARSLDAWRWLHLRNPAGTQVWVARNPDGAVVSQFAGVPRRVKLGSEVITGSEIVDSFTHPDYRRGLQRTGLFVKTALPFVEHHGQPDRNVFMYGLPNPGAYRIGHRFIGYTPVDEDFIKLLTVDVSSAGPADPACPEQVTIGPVDRFSPDCDALFEEVSRRHPITVVKDQPYLNWRYADHPDVRYELLEARECNGALLAAAVLRHGWCDEPVTALCELVLRPHPAFPGVVRYLEGRAREEGSEQIRTLLRPWSPEFAAMADHGWEPEPSHFRLVCGVYRDDVTPERLRDEWFLTLGDFDVV